MNRQFESVDELHDQADKITFTIDFHFTRASYEQKVGRSTMSLYVHCHCYDSFRDQLHDLDNAAEPVSKSRPQA